MKVLIPPIYERNLDADDPLSNDLFGRKFFADNLSRLFQHTDDGLVITINSRWGDGKTSFIHFWKDRISQKSIFIPIYYDAFRNDFSDDAFLSIATSIQESLEKKLANDGFNPKNKKQLESLKKSSKDISKGLLKSSVGYATRVIASTIIKDEKILDDIDSFSQKLLFKTLEEDVDNRFDAFQAQKALVEDYQNTLKAILKGDSKEPLKVIFFVDELDRCRPDFAIQVIEKIKHLFSINNVFFVLAINKEQLLNTFTSVYGLQGENSEIYLQKFIHLETELPPMHGLSHESENDVLSSYIESLLSYCEISQHYGKNNSSFQAFVDLCSSKTLGMNPRGIERTISLIAIAIGSNPVEKISSLIDFIAPMAALKIAEPKLYISYQDGNFHESSEIPIRKTYFNFFKKLFTKDIRETASNAFVVEKVLEACKIINVYDFPGPVKRELFIHAMGTESVIYEHNQED